MKVAYHVADDGGCSYYRMSLPLGTARKNLALDALPVNRAEEVDRAARIIGAADVVGVARMSDKHFPEIIDYYHKLKKKVVMDWDDDVFNVSPMSDFYEGLGTENVKVNVAGQMVDVWKDGKNIDLAGNRETLDRIKRICGMVDMMTVTTENLAGVYRQYCRDVRVLPNCVDLSLWKALPLKREDDSVRMGWFGGSSHFEDWVMLSQVLPEVMAKHKNLRLVIMGQKFDGTLKAIDSDRIEIHPWTHTQAYPYKAAILDLDFAVIPLIDNKFNRSKSTIKYVEMGALGVPSVISHVQPYAELMDLVPDNGIFVDSNEPDAWEAGINVMVENPMLRQKIGEQARKTVDDHFDIEKQYPLWVNAYKEVLAWQPRQTQLSTR